MTGLDRYLRQLRDWKISAEIGGMRPRSMELYARHERDRASLAVAVAEGRVEGQSGL